jgi:hypothetical protein
MLERAPQIVRQTAVFDRKQPQQLTPPLLGFVVLL